MPSYIAHCSNVLHLTFIYTCIHICNRSRPLPPAGWNALPPAGRNTLPPAGRIVPPPRAGEDPHPLPPGKALRCVIILQLCTYVHAVCQYLYKIISNVLYIYIVNAFCSNLQMVVMSYAFPLFFCAHFFQIMLPETYQECLALVARSGDVERAEIARLLRFPPHLLESPDLRRLLRNAYRKYNAGY